MTEPKNLFARFPGKGLGEAFETLVETGALRLERIVSHGQATPAGEWYDQEWDEWVVLLQGSAGLLLEGEREAQTLRPGDFRHIPAHRRHRVEWTDEERPTVWLALHYGP